MDEKITAIQIEYLKSIGQDDEGIYESTHDYEDWDWKEFADWLESALQSAREEIKELTDNGAAAWKSVSDLIQERDTLKAEADRMREAVAEYRKEAETGIAEEKLSGNVVKEAQWRGIETACLYFQAVLTPPAAPEKAETCPTCHGVLAHGGIDPLTGKKCPTCKGTGKPIAEGGE